MMTPPLPVPAHHWWLRIALHALVGLRHWRALLTLWRAPAGSPLSALVRARPEIWGMLQAPFVSAQWKTATRFARIIEHVQTVSRLGRPFDLLPNEYADLMTLDEIGRRYRLSLDQPRWLLRDGLLALNLWEEGDRLFSIAFLVVPSADGLVVYVGGIQGRRGPDSLERYRRLTSDAAGMRPRDLLIELFRTVCAEIGATRILCVSDSLRHQRSGYFTRRPDFVDPVSLDYDLVWRERGAVLRDDGFFELSVESGWRNDSDVPPRKRALYRRRQAVLASLRARLVVALAPGGDIAIHEHEPRWI